MSYLIMSSSLANFRSGKTYPGLEKIGNGTRLFKYISPSQNSFTYAKELSLQFAEASDAGLPNYQSVPPWPEAHPGVQAHPV